MGRMRGLVTLGYYLGLMPFGAAYALMRYRTREELMGVIARRGRRALRLGGLSVEHTGEENLPSGAYVLVYNESSWPDMLAKDALLWGRFADRGAAAAEYGYMPFLKRALRKAGVALVPRGDRAGVDRVLEELTAALCAGERVAFGGEGRMSGIDGVIHFKRGAALLAIRSGTPLIPMASHGGHLLWPWRSLSLRPGTIRIGFGEPLSTQGLNDNNARELADHAQSVVTSMYERFGREER